MNNIDELTAQFASNIFNDLTDQQILFLKFCCGYNLSPELLRSFVTDNQNKKFQVKGFIWKYEYVNFRNNGNFLDNELLIHLRFYKEVKVEELKVDNNIVQVSGSNISLSNVYSGTITGINIGEGMTSYATGSPILTKDSFNEVVNHKQNEVIKNKSLDDVFISLKEFCKKYKSQKFQINEIIQDKRLKIVVV